jgi:hypothetical protein
MRRRILVALIWCAAAWTHPLMVRLMVEKMPRPVLIGTLCTLLIFVLALLGCRLVEPAVRRASWPLAILIGAVAGLAGVFAFFACLFMVSSLCSERPGAFVDCVVDAVRWGWMSVVSIIFLGAGALNIVAASILSAFVLKYRRAPRAPDLDDVSPAGSPERPGG